MVWSWRDLRVFLFLFGFSLLIWTTRLLAPGFGPYQPAAPPQLSAARESALRPAESNPDKPRTIAGPQVDELPSPPRAGDPDEQPPSVLPASLPADAAAILASSQPERAEQYYRLVIPVLKVDSRLIPLPFNGETWDVSGLGQDLGMLETLETQPENRNNLAIAGHFSLRGPLPGPFRYLSRLVPGARIFLYSDRTLYIFQVREQQVVSSTDLSALAPSAEKQLTLLTCDTWDEKSKQFLRRRVIQANLVQWIPLSPAGLE